MTYSIQSNHQGKKDVIMPHICVINKVQ